MIGLAHVLLPLAIASGAHAEATPARTSLVYERTLPSLRELISGPNARPAQRGMLIVEPSADTAYGPARRSAGRVAKVSGGDLAGKSALEIAATLRNAIVNGCVVDGRDFGCASHVVVVDEIDARFDDGPVPKAPRRHFRNRRAARRAGQPPAVPLPPVDPRSPAARLSAAMSLLEVASPYGGSYASRVHFYLAPGLVTSIGAGRGPNDNLGRDGRPHFRTWRGVMPGLARAGGIWLEMYHGRRLGEGYQPFSAVEWLRYPGDLLGVFSAFGGASGRVHFVISNTPRVPAGASACAGRTPMGCVWTLADRAGANRAILTNGPGTYQVGGQAAEWLADHDLHLGTAAAG